jgi:hypothetical protein
MKHFARRAVRSLWTFDAETLCREAQRRTGLQDFGNPPVDPAIHVLTRSLEEEAGLHFLGRFLMRMHLRDILETRLRLVERWTQESERMSAEAILRPVFIVGLPRSGSTYLHELLAETPDFRAPRVWEVMFPVGSRWGRDDAFRRMRKAECCLWWFRRLAPKADAVYPLRAMTPHECVAIQSYTLLSQEFVSTCHVPSFETFLQAADLTSVYQWQRSFLQYLQLDAPGRRWVLKSPDHVYGLEQLLAVFPDASIIQTHRNPVEVVKSSAEVTRVMRGLYGPPGSSDEIRAREARVLAEGAERFIRFRDNHPELAERIIDVRYTDLISDPVATVRRICDGIGAGIPDVMAERVQQLASHRSRYRGTRASAQSGSLGLDKQLSLRFQRYCSRFGLPFREADLCG